MPRSDDATAILPRGRYWRFQRELRFRLVQLTSRVLLRAFLRFRLEGRERLPKGPHVLCSNHLDWIDPFVVAAVLPAPRRYYVFGPKEANMRIGLKNRFIAWVGANIPFRPNKSDLREATRHVQEVLAAGYPVAIAGEGRVAEREDEVLPLNEGAAHFAILAQVPLVPLAINGTRWLRFGKTVRLRVGEPIATLGLRPSREEVERLTAEAHGALTFLVQGYRDPVPPSRFGLWLTELFNSPKRGAPKVR